MLRKFAFCGLMGLVGFCAFAAGADRFLMLALGGLAALGWVGLKSKQ
jgi:hypothetical protein